MQSSYFSRDDESRVKSRVQCLDISQTAKTPNLLEALVELLRLRIGLLPEHIRCSSVDGYRLPAGAHAETQFERKSSVLESLIGLYYP